MGHLFLNQGLSLHLRNFPNSLERLRYFGQFKENLGRFIWFHLDVSNDERLLFPHQLNHFLLETLLLSGYIPNPAAGERDFSQLTSKKGIRYFHKACFLSQEPQDTHEYIRKHQHTITTKQWREFCATRVRCGIPRLDTMTEC